MNFNCIICHYDEIGLKGKNRIFFEKKLIQNLNHKIKENKISGIVRIKRIYGRILIELDNFSDKKKNLLTDILANTFGLANFSFTYKTADNIDDIEKIALEIIQNKKFQTFRITTIRTDKNFPLKSQQVNEIIGATVANKLNKKVKLKNPDLNCRIEIVDKQSYIYTTKIQGLGGLPVGISGKALCLLSGGIDSPVAAWYANKRGLETIFLHFHSYPHTNKASIDKVKKLTNQLKIYSPNSKLYLCPFADLQKQIYSQVPDKYRIIFYRRFMFRIAQTLAKQQKVSALITGEALGQVASQTIENISVIEEVVDLPILRPLVCFDKKEIINKAQKINTYDISILPHDDCCVVFMPKNPATKAKKTEVHALEEKLDVEKLIKQALDKIKLEN